MSDLYDPAFPTGTGLQENKAAAYRQELFMKRDYCSKLIGIGLGRNVKLNQFECKTAAREEDDDDDEPPEPQTGDLSDVETVNTLKNKTPTMAISMPCAESNKPSECKQHKNVDVQNVLVKYASAQLGVHVKHINGKIPDFAGHCEHVSNCVVKADKYSEKVEPEEKNIPVTRDHSYSRIVSSPSAADLSTFNSIVERASALADAKPDSAIAGTPTVVDAQTFFVENALTTCLPNCGIKSGTDHVDREVVISEELVPNVPAKETDSSELGDDYTESNKNKLVANNEISENVSESKDDCASVEYSLLDIPLPEEVMPKPPSSPSANKNDKVHNYPDVDAVSPLPQVNKRHQVSEDKELCTIPLTGTVIEKSKTQDIYDDSGFLDIPLPDSPMPATLQPPLSKGLKVTSNWGRSGEVKNRMKLEFKIPKFKKFFKSLSMANTPLPEVSKMECALPIKVKEQPKMIDTERSTEIEKMTIVKDEMAANMHSFSLQDIPLPESPKPEPALSTTVKEESKTDIFGDTFSECKENVIKEIVKCEKASVFNLFEAPKVDSSLLLNIVKEEKEVVDVRMIKEETKTADFEENISPSWTDTTKQVEKCVDIVKSPLPLFEDSVRSLSENCLPPPLLEDSVKIVSVHCLPSPLLEDSVKDVPERCSPLPLSEIAMTELSQPLENVKEEEIAADVKESLSEIYQQVKVETEIVKSEQDLPENLPVPETTIVKSLPLLQEEVQVVKNETEQVDTTNDKKNLIQETVIIQPAEVESKEISSTEQLLESTQLTNDKEKPMEGDIELKDKPTNQEDDIDFIEKPTDQEDDMDLKEKPIDQDDMDFKEKPTDQEDDIDFKEKPNDHNFDNKGKLIEDDLDHKDKLVEDNEKECQSPQDISSKKRYRKGSRSVGSDSACSSPNDEQPVRRSSRIRSLEEKKGKTKETPKKEESKKPLKAKQDVTPKESEVKKEASKENLSTKSVDSEADVATATEIVQESAKEYDLEKIGAKYFEPRPVCSEAVGQEVVSDNSVWLSPSLESKREEECVARPEKVKSRWRRNSELERVTATPFQNRLDTINKAIPLVSKEAAISEEVFLAPVVPEVPPPVEAVLEKHPAFELITDNIYLFERKRSKSKKEVRRMVCDCAINKEEKEVGLLGCGEDCLNRLLMIECGSRCPLGESCGNKRFQKKQCAKAERFKTQKKGWGLRTVEDLPIGTFVMEYVGEVLSYPEFKQRVKQYAKEKNDHYYFMALKNDEIIDATCKGSLSRFINHSCSPNCETQKWTVNGELRIGFFTTEFVKAGEELTFDYQFQRYGREAQKCYCESKTCRGFIGQDSKISLKSNRTVQKKRRATEEKKREDLEDLALQEEIERLSSTGGLKNKEDTLMFARLMVRAEEVQTRIQLLEIIENTTEPACMRLFLDYHGLPLLWSWMVDVTDEAWELKRKILCVLSLLPITNKTMLLDSKVINVVQRWSLQVDIASKTFKEKDAEQSSSSPPSGTTTPGEEGSIENLSTVDGATHPLPCKRSKRDESVSDSDSAEATQVGSSEEKERTGEEADTSCASVGVRTNVDGDSVERTGSDSLDRVSSTTTMGGEEGTSPSGGSRTDDMSVRSDEESRDAMEFAEKKDRNVPSLACKLLESWSSLKEVFRIPRLERQKRKEDEIAAGQQDMEERRDWESDSRERYRDRKRGRYRVDDGDREFERKMLDIKAKRALLPTPPLLSKEERRQLFAMEVQQRDHEEAIRRQQEEIELSFLEGQGDPALAAAILLEHEQQQQQQQGVMMETVPMQYPQHTYSVDPVTYMPQDPLNFQPQEAVVYPAQEPAAYPPQDALAYQLTDSASYQTQPPPSYECVEPPPMYGTPAASFSSAVPTDAQITVPVAASPVVAVSSPMESQALQLRHPLMPGQSYVDVGASPIQLSPAIHPPYVDPSQPVFKQPQSTAMVYPPPPCQVPYVQTPVPAEALPTAYPSPQPAIASPSPIPSVPPSSIAPGIVASTLSLPSVVTPPQVAPIPVVSTTTTVAPSVPPPYLPGQPQYVTQQGAQLYYVQNASAVVPLSEAQAVPIHGNLPLVHVAVTQAPTAEDTLVPSNPKSKPLKMPPFWKTAKDDEGNTYYYHSITRQTQWDPPVCGSEENDDMDLGTPTFDEPKVHKNVVSSQDGRSSSHKRHSKKKTTTAAADTSSEVAKKIKELFRTKMSSYIVQCLNPYRKPDCRLGRITCTEDFKHLARKLTHFVMSKELKHCKNVEDLECNENVKHKAKDFVYKYMSRYGSTYKKDKGSPKSLSI